MERLVCWLGRQVQSFSETGGGNTFKMELGDFRVLSCTEAVETTLPITETLLWTFRTETLRLGEEKLVQVQKETLSRKKTEVYQLSLWSAS